MKDSFHFLFRRGATAEGGWQLSRVLGLDRHRPANLGMEGLASMMSLPRYLWQKVAAFSDRLGWGSY